MDGRSDIYSLGCTLYFALTGQPPFPGGTSREKVMRHRSEKPTPLGDLAPSLPPGFIDLIDRLMAKDPARRPAAAAAAEAELRFWTAGSEPVSCTPESDPSVQSLDEMCDLPFDEGAVLGQAPGSSEYSLVSLPAVEVLDSSDDPLPQREPLPVRLSTVWLAPAWWLVAVAGLAGLIAWLAQR